jgi:cytochrome P450
MHDIRKRVRSIVRSAFGLLDGESQIDVMSELAYTIPIAVIAELFDIGEEGAEVIRKETPAVSRILDFDSSSEEMTAAVGAATSLMLFLLPIVTDRHKNPGTDLISQIIAFSSTGELKIDELMSTLLLLLIAGHETTANLIGNATALLMRFPDAAKQISADYRVLKGSVEEILRFESPVQLTSRCAKADTELAGVKIGAGRRVVVSIGAANRDPERFENPETFDVTRTGPPHLSFGQGAHFCLGAALARAEVEEFLRLFAPMVPSLELHDGGSSYDSSRTLRRLSKLQLQVHKDSSFR